MRILQIGLPHQVARRRGLSRLASSARVVYAGQVLVSHEPWNSRDHCLPVCQTDVVRHCGGGNRAKVTQFCRRASCCFTRVRQQPYTLSEKIFFPATFSPRRSLSIAINLWAIVYDAYLLEIRKRCLRNIFLPIM